jgi:hypothetical protein
MSVLGLIRAPAVRRFELRHSTGAGRNACPRTFRAYALSLSSFRSPRTVLPPILLQTECGLALRLTDTTPVQSGCLKPKSDP